GGRQVSLAASACPLTLERRAALDLAQGGEVSVDLQRDPDLTALVAVVGHRALLEPHVVDQPPPCHRARHPLVGLDVGSEEELGGEMRSLVEAEQLQRGVADPQDPSREETGVRTEEPVLASALAPQVAE